jgi:lysophospholipase
MWGIVGLSKFAKSFARFMTAIGAGGNFAPGVQQKWKRENFKRNPVTNDKARHTLCQDLIAAEPRLALMGPTNGWVTAAAEVIEALAQPGNFAHLRMPILVTSAGEELLVDNKSHAAVITQFPDATHLHVADAKHEILMERDEPRAQFWAAFDALAARVAPG